MFQRIGPQAFKKDLTNTLNLCKALENPQKKFPAIHIAGTNGKGSVSSMIASVLDVQGYKTGLYTSPHLASFTERIRINGTTISEAGVMEFVKFIQSFIEEIEPSFFEVTVVMAFDHFAKNKVDLAVVEVGMGGRLDSTNVVEPILTVITNISRDHELHLGNTLQEDHAKNAGVKV